MYDGQYSPTLTSHVPFFCGMNSQSLLLQQQATVRVIEKMVQAAVLRRTH